MSLKSRKSRPISRESRPNFHKNRRKSVSKIGSNSEEIRAINRKNRPRNREIRPKFGKFVCDCSQRHKKWFHPNFADFCRISPNFSKFSGIGYIRIFFIRRIFNSWCGLCKARRGGMQSRQPKSPRYWWRAVHRHGRSEVVHHRGESRATSLVNRWTNIQSIIHENQYLHQRTRGWKKPHTLNKTVIKSDQQSDQTKRISNT